MCASSTKLSVSPAQQHLQGRRPDTVQTNAMLQYIHTVRSVPPRSNTYKGGELIEADPKLDWAANLSHMMGGFGRVSSRTLNKIGVDGAANLSHMMGGWRWMHLNRNREASWECASAGLQQPCRHARPTDERACPAATSSFASIFDSRRLLATKHCIPHHACALAGYDDEGCLEMMRL